MSEPQIGPRQGPQSGSGKTGLPAPTERGEQQHVSDNNTEMESSSSDNEMESSSSDDEAEDLPKMTVKEAEDVDVMPEDNDVESAAKRQRIQFLEELEESVQNIMSITSKHCESISSARCNRESIKKIISDLDKSRITEVN